MYKTGAVIDSESDQWYNEKMLTTPFRRTSWSDFVLPWEQAKCAGVFPRKNKSLNQ